MFRTAYWFTTCLLLAMTTPLFAAAPTFKDRAQLFSPAAVTEALSLMEEMRDLYRQDVAVETFKAVPFYKDPWGKVQKMSQAEQDRFVLAWAKDRLSGPNAVLILIVQGPALKNVQVVAGRSLLAQRGFTTENCRDVRERLHRELSAGQADAGLLAALRLVHALLHDNLGEDGGAAPFDWEAWLAVALFVGAVVSAVLFVRRRRPRSVAKPADGFADALLRTPDNGVVAPNGPVKSVHEPLKDWW